MIPFYFKKTETKNGGEQMSTTEISDLRSGAPASLVAKDSAPSEPEILNRAEPIGFHVSNKNLVDKTGNGSIGS